MQRQLLLAKIHRATITDRNVDYEGSITIDPDLLERGGILPWEKVLVADINNGSRFDTYAVFGKRGSGEVVVNGAAARLVELGDLVIVMAFGFFAEAEALGHQPVVVKVDARNRLLKPETP